jgi:replication factor C subunit 2/4
MNNYIPWIEKYKPTNFNELISHENIINTIIKNIDSLPHLIFFGPPGCGKSTLINIITNHIYKKNDMRYNILSLNASDERGINTVRYKIKNFSQKSIVGNYKFKMIILDEADSLTYDAQNALRRIMEVYSKTTRFVFICNYKNKIIDAIMSRCSIFQFNKISNDILNERLYSIAECEDMENYREYIPAITKISNGDMRNSIIVLETIEKINKGKYITKEDVYELMGIIPHKVLFNILKNIKTFDDVNYYSHHLYNLSYSTDKILDVFNEIILNYDINEDKKINILLELSSFDKMIKNNCDTFIIILNLLTLFYENTK